MSNTPSGPLQARASPRGTGPFGHAPALGLEPEGGVACTDPTPSQVPGLPGHATGMPSTPAAMPARGRPLAGAHSLGVAPHACAVPTPAARASQAGRPTPLPRARTSQPLRRQCAESEAAVGRAGSRRGGRPAPPAGPMAGGGVTCARRTPGGGPAGSFRRRGRGLHVLPGARAASGIGLPGLEV